MTKGNGYFVVRPHGLRRCVDLQYESICRCLKTQISSSQTFRRVLDVGAGSAPYRRFFPESDYLTLDKHEPADYQSFEEIPRNKKFDLILLIEVLEHVEDLEELFEGIGKVLSSAGQLWISVPFAARIHRAPEDYRRFTDEGLKRVLASHGFGAHTLKFRGTELTSLFAKLFYIGFRSVPLSLPFLCGLPCLLALAHCTLRFDIGSPEDPLGFFAVATKLPARKETGKRVNAPSQERARSEILRSLNQ